MTGQKQTVLECEGVPASICSYGINKTKNLSTHLWPLQYNCAPENGVVPKHVARFVCQKQTVLECEGVPASSCSYGINKTRKLSTHLWPLQYNCAPEDGVVPKHVERIEKIKTTRCKVHLV